MTSRHSTRDFRAPRAGAPLRQLEAVASGCGDQRGGLWRAGEERRSHAGLCPERPPLLPLILRGHRCSPALCQGVQLLSCARPLSPPAFRWVSASAQATPARRQEKTLRSCELQRMWAPSDVGGLLGNNVGPFAENVGLRHRLSANNVGPIERCWWVRGIMLVGRYTYAYADRFNAFIAHAGTVFFLFLSHTLRPCSIC